MSAVILLGGTGYIGQAFHAELKRRECDVRLYSRSERDYTRFEVLLKLLRDTKPAFLINAAGYTGKPNVDACESARSETLLGNTLLPQTIAQACAVAEVPWGHVSSGCIFAGAKIALADGSVRVERDMTTPAMQALVRSDPGRIRGFREDDAPNFSFRRGPCSFYSGTKALGEEAIAGVGRSYVWRLRIPFDEVDSPRNYLSKILTYPKVYDNVNSLSHRGDYVRACLDLWQLKSAYGIYNITNAGWVTTREVVELIRERLAPSRQFQFWEGDAEFYKVGAITPRSNCVLETEKAFAAGAKMAPVKEALRRAMAEWRGRPVGGVGEVRV